jgi:hypothetical protein
MASHSSSSTKSPRTSMRSPSDASRSEVPSHGRAVTQTKRPPNERAGARGPSANNKKSLAEIKLTGRQSQQGDRPKATVPPPSSRRAASRRSK